MTTALAVTAASWGVLMALAPVLQIRKIRMNRSARDVSLAYLSVLLVGFVLWLGYGLSLGNPALVVPNTIALLVCAVTIAVALRYR
jgi:MtN3 and saliva related transmembrane protein